MRCRRRRRTRAHRDQCAQRIAHRPGATRIDRGRARAAAVAAEVRARSSRPKLEHAQRRDLAMVESYQTEDRPAPRVRRAHRICGRNRSRHRALGVANLRAEPGQPAAPGRRPGTGWQAGQPRRWPSASTGQHRELLRQQQTAAGSNAARELTRNRRHLRRYRELKATAPRSAYRRPLQARRATKRSSKPGSPAPDVPASVTRSRAEPAAAAIRTAALRSGATASSCSRNSSWMRASASLVVGIEAQHQDRRGVGGAHQAPAVRPVDAQAVDGGQARAFELRRHAEALDEGVRVVARRHRTLISGVDMPSGSALSTSSGVSALRRPGFPAGARRHRCRRRSRTSAPVKKKWPLISPASSASVSRILALISEWPVFHISGLPPWRRIQPWQLAGALHVVHDHRARVAFQHVGGEQHQQAVGEDDLAFLGHHAQAVAVAIEGQAQVGIEALDRLDQVLEVVRLAGIGMVVGEGAVDLAEQRDDLGADGLQQLRRDAAGHAVAGIHHHLQRAVELHVVGDALRRNRPTTSRSCSVPGVDASCRRPSLMRA